MKLDARIKELIAVGASIAANCQPCLEYHTNEARKHGADPDALQEAIEVGKLVRRGAAAKMDKFAASLLQSGVSTTSRQGDECGCES